VRSGDTYGGVTTLIKLTADEIERGAPWHFDELFGPIPERPAMAAQDGEGDMAEEQINHALRRRYGCPQDTIDDPDREPEQVILDELQAGPSWLDCLCACGRCITARHRLLLSGQIEPDPHGWRLSKT
jgi:hypothetical protein